MSSARTSSLRLDGRSLIDGRVPERSSTHLLLREPASTRHHVPSEICRPSVPKASNERSADLARGDLTALYAPPGARHLLGMNVSRSAMHPAPDVQITIRNPRQFEAVNRDRDPLPLYVRGVLSTSRSEPLSVAVVVNGIVAAVTAFVSRTRRSHVWHAHSGDSPAGRKQHRDRVRRRSVTRSFRASPFPAGTEDANPAEGLGLPAVQEREALTAAKYAGSVNRLRESRRAGSGQEEVS